MRGRTHLLALHHPPHGVRDRAAPTQHALLLPRRLPLFKALDRLLRQLARRFSLALCRRHLCRGSQPRQALRLHLRRSAALRLCAKALRKARTRLGRCLVTTRYSQHDDMRRIRPYRILKYRGVPEATRPRVHEAA